MVHMETDTENQGLYWLVSAKVYIFITLFLFLN